MVDNYRVWNSFVIVTINYNLVLANNKVMCIVPYQESVQFNLKFLKIQVKIRLFTSYSAKRKFLLKDAWKYYGKF